MSKEASLHIAAVTSFSGSDGRHLGATGGSPTLLRRVNVLSVLAAVREHGPLSRTHLRDLTRLSRPTINEVVAELVSAGYLIDEADRGQRSGPGPAPRLLRFRAELGHVCGIDIGANTIRVQVARLDGEAVASIRDATSPSAAPGETIRRVRGAVRACCDRAGISESQLRQAVVSTPGIVDPTTDAVFLAPQLRGWEALKLAEALSLPCPTLIENEMHLAVLGERWRGAAKGVDDVVYLGLGVGIGAGIVLGGRLHRGRGGSAGEIGYLPVSSGRRGARGKRGQFEAVAGTGRASNESSKTRP